MKGRLLDLGWREVEVVDEDLGKSAEGYAERTGFERVASEVCMGKVGVVAARELSRLARNSRDWQRLIEVCKVVDTLLVDHETIYDPRRGNDRLLLGLKGSLNEYELDVLRVRSVEARREKARRGELIVIAPVGYVKTAVDGGLEKEPDRRVQEAIELVFRKTLEFGAVRQTFLWLIERGVNLPARRHGPDGWKTIWKRPTYSTVIRILKNPVYAGAYVYGRTGVAVELKNGTTQRKLRRKPADRWIALIHDHHEGYIGREGFERIQKMISKNAQMCFNSDPGAPKSGRALLAGRVRCRRCARKLMVGYAGRGDIHRYVCRRGAVDNAEPSCISFAGRSVDEAVSREVLRVVEPGAVEAAVLAGREAAEEKDEVVRALELDLEAARYATDRAWRQYDAADPENRLVAGELEGRWNAALEEARELEARTERERIRRQGISPPTVEEFKDLAQDLGRVWDDPATDVRLKKRIVRALTEEVIADIDEEANEIVLVIRWKGGVHTELRVRRRRRGEGGAHTSPDIVDAVKVLTLINSDRQIAGYLNRNGLRTGRGNRFTQQLVVALRCKRGIPVHSPERRWTEGWMNLTEAAACLGVKPKTLRRAAERGDIEAMHPLPDGPWVFKREHLAGPAGRKVIERARRRRKGAARQAPGQLSLFPSSTYPGGAV
jgi:DNA invertase Pin-like site-specific DNA recombinase